MFSIIVAHSKNNVIGKDNKIPWYIPEDLQRFKDITTGKKILMGRKTFESLPFVLPNRTHLVVTKNESYTYNHPDVEIHTNLNKLIKLYQNSKEEVFVIGGEEIYKLLSDISDKMYITEVFINCDGDAFFPAINTALWHLEKESEIFTSNNLKFRYKNYIKS